MYIGTYNQFELTGEEGELDAEAGEAGASPRKGVY